MAFRDPENFGLNDEEVEECPELDEESGFDHNSEDEPDLDDSGTGAAGVREPPPITPVAPVKGETGGRPARKPAKKAKAAAPKQAAKKPAAAKAPKKAAPKKAAAKK